MKEKGEMAEFGHGSKLTESNEKKPREREREIR